MAGMSKLMGDGWTVPYNCYEVGHSWTPHCSEASVELFLICFQESIKIYSPLYLASQIILSRRYDLPAFQESIKSILQSSMFLSTNAFAILFAVCLCRSFTEGFYHPSYPPFVEGFIPMFFAAFAAILVERPSRRFPLAVYVANIASECAFRICHDYGYVPSVPKGEVWMFTASMATLLYMVKKQGYGRDPVSMALRFYLGNKEAGRPSGLSQMNKPVLDNKSSTSRWASFLSNFTSRDMNANLLERVSVSESSWLSLFTRFRHQSCKHDEGSCFMYSFNGFYQPFLATWIGYTLFGSLKKYNEIARKPGILMNLLFSERNLRFGLFFGSFSGVYKATSCLLRHYSNRSEDWHALVAGAAAGPSMLFNPNTTIALYIFWKCLETLYWKGVESGKFTNPIRTANIVYSISVAQVAFCLLLYPKHMRPSYMRFIDQITGHRFHQINRLPMYALVPEAVIGYEDFFPNLDPKYMTDKFMSSVFIWLI